MYSMYCSNQTDVVNKVVCFLLSHHKEISRQFQPGSLAFILN